MGRKGFTLFEVILAIFILVVAIVPLLDAYRPSLFATLSEEQTIVSTSQARRTLNRVACADFGKLDSLVTNRNDWNVIDLNVLFPDGPSEGVDYTPTVKARDASYDDKKGIKIGGLLEIEVTVNRIKLSTLKADY